jgi:hypothetical protein
LSRESTFKQFLGRQSMKIEVIGMVSTTVKITSDNDGELIQVITTYAFYDG